MKPTRVLIVDDSPDFVEPIVYWLQAKGFEVGTASNGKQALLAIQDDHPDIVFLDIQMPEMDGLETLKKIRAAHKDLPVVMITAIYQDPKNFSVARKLGVSGFYPKESSLHDLLTIIETTLRINKPRK